MLDHEKIANPDPHEQSLQAGPYVYARVKSCRCGSFSCNTPSCAHASGCEAHHHYAGHNYIGHDNIGHNYRGHNYGGRASGRDAHDHERRGAGLYIASISACHGADIGMPVLKMTASPTRSL